MKKFLTRWFVNSLALVFVVNIVPGIIIDNWIVLAVATLAIGMLNAFLKPLIVIITLPINILSLGIFTLFINCFIFYIASKLVGGFVILSFKSAFFGALMYSLLSFIFNIFIKSSVVVKSSGREQARRKRYENAIDVESVEDEKNKGANKQLK